MNRGGDTVFHTYGVVQVDGLAPSTPGIDRAPVRLLGLGGMAVLASDLDASRFGPDEWAAHGQDPTWLEPVALAHHLVLQAVCDSGGDVVPLRLPGIYPDEQRVRAALGARTAELHRAMDDVQGCAEWGVKVFLLTDTSPAPSRPATGRDYLTRRSEQAQQRATARDGRHRLLIDAFESLTGRTARSVANPPQDKALTGRREPMLLNSAHLVEREGQSAFLDLLGTVSRGLAAHGMLLEVSGPWPPYNFTGLHQAAESA